VNALNVDAVDQVFQLKGRDYSKPIHVVVRDLNQAARYVVINEVAQEIVAQFLPGALTLVLSLKAGAGIPALLVAGGNTLGIRIPNHTVCKVLSQALDFPVTTTSANRSGQPNTYDMESIERQLATDFDKIDLAIDGGTLPSGSVSTVI